MWLLSAISLAIGIVLMFAFGSFYLEVERGFNLITGIILVILYFLFISYINKRFFSNIYKKYCAREKKENSNSWIFWFLKGYFYYLNPITACSLVFVYFIFNLPVFLNQFKVSSSITTIESEVTGKQVEIDWLYFGHKKYVINFTSHLPNKILKVRLPMSTEEGAYEILNLGDKVIFKIQNGNLHHLFIQELKIKKDGQIFPLSWMGSNSF